MLYRGDRPFPDLRNKAVMLIDDGLATGSTMRAAVGGSQSANDSLPWAPGTPTSGRPVMTKSGGYFSYIEMKTAE